MSKDIEYVTLELPELENIANDLHLIDTHITNKNYGKAHKVLMSCQKKVIEFCENTDD